MDYISHLVLVGLTGMAVLKLLKTEGLSSASFLPLLCILTIVLARMALIIFLPAWCDPVFCF